MRAVPDLLDVALPEAASGASDEVQLKLKAIARGDILSRTYAGTFMYPAVGLFLGAFGWRGALGPAVTIAFVATLTAIVVARVLLYRRAIADTSRLRPEGRGHFILGIASSFLTSMYGVALLFPAEGSGSTIGLVVTVAIVATLVNITSPHRPLALLWVGSCIVPTVPLLLLHGGLLGYGMAALFCLYTLMVIRAVRLSWDSYWRGLLAGELLAEETKRTVALSRHAGMAEIATNVLHDVGNTLNSVKTTACVLSELHQRDPADDLRLLEAAIGKAAPTSEKLLEFIAELSANAAERRDAVQSELVRLHDHLQHIEIVVRRQQEIAKGASEEERCVAHELVDEALELLGCRHDPAAHGIEVNVPSGLAVQVDRHRTLQILLNLLHNAIEATREVDAPTVWVDAWPDQDDRVVFVVSDNGVGADETTASRIFSRGFTTKPHGHGFGLHNAGLIARAMGGSLRFESEGMGQGASLTLELPAAPAERRHRTTKRLSTRQLRKAAA